MSRIIRNLILGGSCIMAMPQSATAGELIIVNPANFYDPTQNGYSHAVIVPSGARLAYISGQGGQDARGRLSADFAAQVKQAYGNLQMVLTGLGARPGQVVKLTLYVVEHDMAKLGILTAAVKEMFGTSLPAQTLVPVDRLAVDGMLFEVEAIALID